MSSTEDIQIVTWHNSRALLITGETIMSDMRALAPYIVAALLHSELHDRVMIVTQDHERKQRFLLEAHQNLCKLHERITAAATVAATAEAKEAPALLTSSPSRANNPHKGKEQRSTNEECNRMHRSRRTVHKPHRWWHRDCRRDLR